MKTFAVQQFEAEQIKKINQKRTEDKKTVPYFAPGYLLKINYIISEGSSTRIQAYEGVCIGIQNTGISTSFIVRKLSGGKFAVERSFKLYSPLISSIEVLKTGSVRRAKLYYLRGRFGKSARIESDYNASQS